MDKGCGMAGGSCCLSSHYIPDDRINHCELPLLKLRGHISTCEFFGNMEETLSIWFGLHFLTQIIILTPRSLPGSADVCQMGRQQSTYLLDQEIILLLINTH